MKIRQGFVSNSSSSSFLCCVCGALESGMDASLCDFEMAQCLRGHTFCESHMTKEARDVLHGNVDDDGNVIDPYPYSEDNKDDAEYCDGDNIGDYEVPTKYCPICQCQEFTTKDLLAYVLKRYANMTRSELEDSIRENVTPKEFWAYIKDK